MPKTYKYKWVTPNPDRHGRVRWRFRRAGSRQCYLPNPRSPEFPAAYAAAISGERQTKSTRTRKYSIKHGIKLYKITDGYIESKASTKDVYDRLLNRIADSMGDKSVITMKRKDLVIILRNIKSPTTRNRIHSLLSMIFDACIEEEWIETNPASNIKKLKIKTEGHHSWTKEERNTFKEAYAPGTMERLAFSLLYYTSQRGGDVYLMGRQHIKNGFIKVTQEKTGTELELPLAPELVDEIARHPVGMTFITKADGLPYKKKPFQQWFSKKCDDANLPHCSAHGLRKARAAKLAESNATTQEIMATTGHKDIRQAQRYVDKADQKRLADRAMKKARVSNFKKRGQKTRVSD